jgi:hypothetical protein
MSEILRSPITGNAIYLTPRSASHSFAFMAMQTFWPNITIGINHPSIYFGVEEWWNGTNKNIGIILRNPIERFRSMCAHKPDKTLEEHLNQPIYGPLPKGDFKYFLFENQLEECAEWLGLPSPLPKINDSIESNKPILTTEQEAIVRKIYMDDIILWNKLQNKENI